jgi:hypothetical protein
LGRRLELHQATSLGAPRGVQEHVGADDWGHTREGGREGGREEGREEGRQELVRKRQATACFDEIMSIQ